MVWANSLMAQVREPLLYCTTLLTYAPGDVQSAPELAEALGTDFELVDQEDIAQVCEAAPGEVHIRSVHATVWRRLAHPEISTAEPRVWKEQL